MVWNLFKTVLCGLSVFIFLNIELLADSCSESETGVFVYSLKSPIPSQVQISIRRFVRLEGQAVILSHALALNNLVMERLGCELWQKGYDVWMPNMRGHGNGDERSVVEPYFKGAYHFDHIVTEDWPKLLKYVYKFKNRQKVHILGYSMGGMSWEQTLGGVYKSFDGFVYRSDDMVQKRSLMVASYTGLVVPPDFEKTSGRVLKLALKLKPIIHGFNYFIPLSLNWTPGKKLPWWRIDKNVYNKLLGFFGPSLGSILPAGIIEDQNASKQELKALAREFLSSPHADYSNDFLRWFKEGYVSRDFQVNYGRNKKIAVPKLLIYADRDYLVPAEHAVGRAQDFPQEANTHIAIVEGFSHIDIAMQKGVAEIIEPITTFLAYYR